MLWFAQNSLPLWWQRQPKKYLNNGDEVVICSKFITFVVTKTTKHFSVRMMWCCDLLKIHYLCGDKDNQTCYLGRRTVVVICSKFITFVVTKTTPWFFWFELTMLWFAQNSLPLWWQRQPGPVKPLKAAGCDLLKIHYLCGDKDNQCRIISLVESVVICSKFITFVVTKTTGFHHVLHGRVLWFAQNSLPLWWQRQL